MNERLNKTPMLDIAVSLQQPVNYASLLTREVAVLFEGNRTFLSWEPLMAQLVWELRQQRIAATYSSPTKQMG